MAQKAIVWTETASRQLHHILEYWVERNGSATYSLKLLDLIEKRTAGISEKPRICKRSVFSDTRVASMGHYSIYYKISETKIIITAFWDNRQDPKKLLKLMKKG
ncbi:MAG: type II toxin-antitoxin system RelE/ParE family toxin [Flavobacteriales bacterium]|nr:type II toxin-antitoxin system RelE/ParE family toxin [Flavobacteriales bacterium]